EQNIYYLPPDRFGSNFVYENGLLLINHYDIQNELQYNNPIQTTISVDSSNDKYLESLNYIEVISVYENGKYMGKIVPKIDYEDSQYSIASINPIYEKSIRNFYGDDNPVRALDICLDGRFSIHGDRIVLRDPLSLYIFEKTAS